MEYTFGSTETHPQYWKKLEPCWEDEQLTATSKHIFEEFVGNLCETAICKRRGEFDSSIHGHLWNLRITTLEQAYPKSPTERLTKWYNGRCGNETKMTMTKRDT